MKKFTRISVSGFTAISLLALTILVMVGQAWARESQEVAVATTSRETTEFRQEAVSLNQPGVIKFLSGPNAGDPLDIALAFIQANRELLGLSESDLADIMVTDLYQTKDTGVTHIYLRQRHQGLEVAGANLNINIAADGSVINLGSHFVSNLAENIQGDAPALTAAAATEAAAQHLKLTITQPLVVEESLGGASQAVILSDGGISINPIPARLVYQPYKDGIRLAWNVTIYQMDSQHWWDMQIDAATGEVLAQDDWVDAEQWGAPTAASFLTGTYRVYTYPAESPNHVTPLPPADGRQLAIDPADPTASPLGWHDTDGVGGPEFTTTQGNNVHAYTDTDSNNVPDAGSSPDGTVALNFDFPLDLTQAPSAYQPAAVTNLFYWNNLIHDVSYLHGFDEAAGNFQENNYGNGGAGSDYVLAEAQDGGGNCNANFATPADGQNPRMQMYTCANTSPARDGSLDNGVVLHEYGHGISNRLTGGPANVNCLGNLEQMGEGWSDWQALIHTMEVGDSGSDSRGMGTWLFGEGANGPGIRPAPYSTDLGINDYTYGDIGGMAIPHGVGFVWATMLWEMNWALINVYGFNPNIYDDWATGGNNLAYRLVQDGMKLQTCSPGFVDGRDAILQADQVLTGGVNQCTIWEAFAKRGLGFSADQGSSSSTTDGTEAFDTPISCQTLDVNPTSQSICAGDVANYLVDVGGAYTPPVTMSASGNPSPSTTAFTPNPVVSVPNTTTLEIANTAGAAAGSYTITITGTDGITTDSTIATLDVYTTAPTGIPTLVSPPDGAVDVGTAPDFAWTAVANADEYLLEVSTDPTFTTIVYSATVASTSHSASMNLAASTLHYWRVAAQNPCGAASASTTFSFTTVNIICSMPNLAITDLASAQDTINVANVGFITDLDISLDVSHTWVGDMDFTLEHIDTGTTVVFYDRPGVPGSTFGCSGNDINATINDEGTDGPVEDACAPSTPTIQGDFIGGDPPSTSLLSAFDSEDLSGDWQLTVFDNAGGDTGVLNEWCLIPSTTTALGTLTGNVTADESGAPIEGANIAADNGVQTFNGMTDASGNYTMTLGVGDYDVTASVTNRLPVALSAINIMTSSTTIQDFVLAGGLLSYSPPAIEEFMEIGDVVTNTVTVTNSGVLTVEWSVDIGNFGGPSAVTVMPSASQPLGIPVENDVVNGSNKASNAEVAPTSLQLNSPAALGDLLFEIDAETPTGHLLLLGLEYVNGSYYVTSGGATGTGDPNVLFQLDANGNVLNSWTQPTSSAFGWRDLAYDGTYLYASDSNVLDEIDLATGTTTGNTIPCPDNPCRALAYDPATDHFWTQNFAGSLYEFDRSGTIINTFSGSGLNAYGAAWDQWSPGGPYLWIWSQDSSTGHLATQIDPVTGTPTGTSFEGQPIGGTSGFAGGATIHPNVNAPTSVLGQLTLLGLHQTSPDSIAAYDLDVFVSGTNEWPTAVPSTGSIPPFSVTTFDVIFDSRSLVDIGTFTADLTFDGTYVNMVDPIPLTMHLSCPTCGFLDGSITDAFTSLPLPADVHVTSAGGFDYTFTSVTSYSLAIPAGDYDITASSSGYFSQTANVSLSTGVTTTQDFALVPIFGELVNDPTSYDVTVALGYSQTLPLDLTNNGTIDVFYEIFEQDGGSMPTPLTNSEDKGKIIWLYRNTDGVPVSTSDSGATMAYPGAYRYLPANVVEGGPNILVYTDDWIHTTPNTLVQDALSRLGLAATVHVDGDYPGFETSLTTGGPWDLVIWSGENYAMPSTTLTELLNYLQGGGKLAATYWQQLNIPADPLWAEMGFTYISNYVTPPPAYWWQSGHPLFNIPESAPEWLTRVQNSGTSQGTRLEPTASGTAMAGYTTTPTANEAGIILRNDNNAVYKGIRDVSTNADADTDGVLDGTELWENIIVGLLSDFSGGEIPWLHQDPISGTVSAMSTNVVDITFDATVVTQTGQYFGNMVITNDAHGDLVVPVTMTVVAGVFDVSLSPDDALSGDPGATVTYNVLVENTGNVIDTYDLTISGNSWTTNLPSSVTVANGDTETVTVTVDVPAGAAAGDMDMVTVTATSQSDGSATDNTNLTTTANAVYGVTVATDMAATGNSGSSVTYQIWVTNTGNIADSFTLSVSGESWTTTLSTSNVPLTSGAGTMVMVTVDIPGSAVTGDMDTATVTATSDNDGAVSDSVNLTTTAEGNFLYLPLIVKP